MAHIHEGTYIDTYIKKNPCLCGWFLQKWGAVLGKPIVDDLHTVILLIVNFGGRSKHHPFSSWRAME